ncbi:MAG: hypothetical protein JWM68_3408, partial [Verrucomicrobiales bacterium]|nr:hypothetical protein [Verrucomicrobiales bacterium]
MISDETAFSESTFFAVSDETEKNCWSKTGLRLGKSEETAIGVRL